VNKTSATEWLKHSYHDLNGAMLLYKANHYTDTVSYVLHQSLEKSLKAILAYHNTSIKKSHNLVDLYELLHGTTFNLDDDDVFLLAIASKYYSEQRYPMIEKAAPTMEEIKQILDLSVTVFNKVCTILNIDPEEVKL